MDLKNALSICLISLFSATLVVLVARSLDNQAAARLEPYLQKIGEELAEIRQQGGVVGARVGASTSVQPAADHIMVYYFHGNVRCPTCEAIESQARDLMQQQYAQSVEQGEIVWKIVNYEKEVNAALKDRFAVQVPVVVLAKIEGGEVVQWKRLDQVWALWNEPPAIATLMQSEIQAMLDADPVSSPADAADASSLHEDDDEGDVLDAIPLPTDDTVESSGGAP